MGGKKKRKMPKRKSWVGFPIEERAGGGGGRGGNSRGKRVLHRKENE